MSRDDIRSNKRFELRTGDEKVPYDIEITIVSADGANDGWLPFGATGLAIDTIWTTDTSGTTVTGIINGTPSISSDRIEMDLDYPTGGAGDYQLWSTISYSVGGTTRKKTLKAARIKAYA
jgi:hypothetical protein